MISAVAPPRLETVPKETELVKKVVLIGDSGAGKKSLLKKVAYTAFDPEKYVRTIGTTIGKSVIRMPVDGVTVYQILLIWDITGTASNTLWNSACRGAGGVVIAVNAYDPDVVGNARRWVGRFREIDPDAPIAIALTKSDAVDEEEGKKKDGKDKEGAGGEKKDEKKDGKEGKGGGGGEEEEKEKEKGGKGGGKEEGKEKEGEEKKGKEKGKEDDKAKKGKDDSKEGDGYGNPWKRGKRAKAQKGHAEGEPSGAEIDLDTPGGGLTETHGTFEYPQWDCQRKVYLPGWAHVNEQRVGMLPGFKHRAGDVGRVVNAVKTAFLRLKPADLVETRGLPEGEEIDVNRLIDWVVDKKLGGEREEDFWIQRRRTKRSVACAVLLDCSGSTHGEVIEVEKDALEVFAAAMGAIGDPNALYAFNSRGRENTYFYIAKDFDERAEGRPQFYANHANRDGAAYRHATMKLLARKEKRKILIIISDGVPYDDGTEYVGRYAIEDTRKAVDEAVNKGIIVFCVAVRPTGNDRYLNEIYGEGRVCAIRKDIQELLAILPFLYRRLAGLR